MCYWRSSVTTEQANENCFDYLVALQRHKQAVAADPSAWLPWNYRPNLMGESKDNTIVKKPDTSYSNLVVGGSQGGNSWLTSVLLLDSMNNTIYRRFAYDLQTISIDRCVFVINGMWQFFSYQTCPDACF